MRLLIAFLALFILTAPARADDISAAGRGVVRVVTIAFVDDEVVGFGHGSGFAVAPDRIVTNAHVVELAARYPGNVLVGVVPSQGSKAVQGRLIAVDPARDLALIEVKALRLAPLTLYGGPVNDGDALVALGYPGNVDAATARSATDFITPLSPIRSQGVFSGARQLGGNDVLLHTASIARGNSGGPLLDRCGRVVGVNSAVTRGEDGDASFGFAIADTTLQGFLREAGQAVQTVGAPCISIEDRLAADSADDASARSASEAAARDAAERARIAREAALTDARAANETLRENVMATAAVLLVAGALAIGGAFVLAGRGDRRARWAGAGGAVLMASAVVTFLARPSFDPASVRSPEPVAAPAAAAAAAAGRLICRFQPERSRITVSAASDTALTWDGAGCVNGKTQYSEDGHGGWARVLVPDAENTVSVLSLDPATLRYSATRFLLSDEEMAGVRRLRRELTVRGCTADQAQRAALAGQQSAIRAALPRLPNEKLVYSCAVGATTGTARQ